jgi:histidine triad (HIT) family protein
LRSNDCVICRAVNGETDRTDVTVYRNNLWIIEGRPLSPVAGWLKLSTCRHVSDFAKLNDAEITSFGPVMRDLQNILIAATGAHHVYTMSLCERVRHFHVTLIPRYEIMPQNALGIDAFQLMAAAGPALPGDLERAERIYGYVTGNLASPNWFNHDRH